MADEVPRRRSILSLPLEIVVTVYLVLDAIIAPVFRPAMRWLSSLRLIQRLEEAIGTLPPYVLLVLLVVPFGVAELAKVYAVLLMAEDHVRTGVAIFIAAYVISILVCERIFHAGKGQLLTIGWFRRLYDWVMAIRERLLGWFRETAVWRLAAEVRERGRALVRRVQAVFGARPKGSAGRS